MSLKNKTLLAVCTPGAHGAGFLKQMSEFLNVHGFGIRFMSSSALNKNKNCVREAILIASRTQFLFLSKLWKT
jgi:hypothetical protein